MHFELKPATLQRVMHLVWAALALSVSLVVIFGGGGHPPPVVFLPLVVAIWIAGHVVIWGITALAARGQGRGHEAQANGRWPATLRLALALTGIGACLGMLQVIATLVLDRMYPYPDANLWALMFGVWLVHGAGLVGLLLRRAWSGVVCATLAFGWALLAGWQIADHVLRGHRVEVMGMLIVAGFLIFLIWIGVDLSTSRRVRSFLRKP